VEAGLPYPSRRFLALDRALAWRLTLGSVFVASVTARSWAAFRRATPDFFPDESTYASLSRSLAQGHLPAVRGHVAHFPALLEPLLTAPAWWFGSLETGYRVTQVIGSVAISTTALLVWWGARRLGVGRGTALAAAGLAVAVPDVGYASSVLSEPFAYPLFVAAIVTGSCALARPTQRSQALFVSVALLATFARLQLVVLVPAYLVAALLLGRLRSQRVVLAGSIVAFAGVVVALLGFYRGAGFHSFSPAGLGRNAMVLALAAGWIVVPAGLLGIAGAWLRPRSDLERAFGAYAAAAGVAVLLEATLYGNGAIVYERYGFYVLPLIFLGFALHASRGWPWLRAHAALAAAMFAIASVVTLAGWSASHSLLLLGLLRLQQAAGSPGAAGVAVALVAGGLSLASIACAWRRLTAVVAIAALVFCVTASALETSFESRNTQLMKSLFLPAGADWIAGPATVVVGVAPRPSVFQQFFWNRGATAVALLPGVPSPDTFAATTTGVTKSGRLAGLTGRVVLDEAGAALVPVEPLRWNGTWLEAATPELAAELDGRADGWLPPSGSGHVYRPGQLSFTVTALERMSLAVAGRRVQLRASVPTPVSVCTSGVFHYSFSRYRRVGFRVVSAFVTFPVWRAAPGC